MLESLEVDITQRATANVNITIILYLRQPLFYRSSSVRVKVVQSRISIAESMPCKDHKFSNRFVLYPVYGQTIEAVHLVDFF